MTQSTHGHLNGQPYWPTIRERRKTVADALQADPEASDRHISRVTHCSREMVTAIRLRLTTAGTIPDPPGRRGRDGKTYHGCGKSHESRADRQINNAARRLNRWAAVLADSAFAETYNRASRVARRNLQAVMIRLNAAENRRRREVGS